MTGTQESIRRSIEVPVGAQRAFDHFTARMTDWWPSDHHIGETPIARIVIEPHEGGRWYTVHEDGSETSTSYVRVWEPPAHLELTWQIGPDWTFRPQLVTVVVLHLIELAPDRTRVELEHRRLEAYGDAADRMREVFEDPGAWTATLAAYAQGLGS